MRKIDKKWIAVIVFLLFFVRVSIHLTSNGLSFRGYDEFLHFFVVKNVISPCILFEKNISELVGIETYSYPVLFHVFSRVIGITSPFFAILFSSLLGILTLCFIFFSFKKIVNKETALLAVLLLSFSANFLYKSSLFIPENLALLFLSIFLYFIFSRRFPLAFLIIIPWMLTHRSWAIAPLLVAIYFISKLSLKKEHKKLAIVLSLAVFFVSACLFYFFEVFERFGNVNPSLLGFFKWVGIVQIIAGLLGLKYFIGQKNIEKRFISVWALVFLFLSAVSFRIRDPYLSIPFSLLSSYYIVKNIKNKILFKFLVIFTCISGFAFCYFSLPFYEEKEVNALEWVKENTEKNATILTWWNIGYKVIGMGERKDILTWEKFVKPFYSAPISLFEAEQIYNDMLSMFSAPEKEEIFYLLKKYNVSYIYIDREMRSYGIVKRGLGELVGYHPAFIPLIVNGYAELYYFDKSSVNKTKKILPKMESNLAKFFAKFWNGYSFSDYGVNVYKGLYKANAEICSILSIKESKNTSSKVCEYVKEYLSIKQLPNGGFASFIPPFESVYETSSIVYFDKVYLKNYFGDITKKAENFIKFKIKNVRECNEMYVKDFAMALRYVYSLSMHDEVEEIKNYLKKCVELKKRKIENGLATCYGIASYYLVSNDKDVEYLLRKCCSYLEEVKKRVHENLACVRAIKYACGERNVNSTLNIESSSPLTNAIEYIDYLSIFMPLSKSVERVENEMSKYEK